MSTKNQSSKPSRPDKRSVLKRLQHSTAAWFILSLTTIVSLVFAVVSTMQAHQKREITYTLNTTEIVTEGVSSLYELELKYKGKDIDNLSVTEITFSNSGNTVIKGADIPTAAPISITGYGNCNIIDVQKVEVSNTYSDFSLEEDAHGQFIWSFDYLEPGEYARYNVWHTGNDENLSVDGTIIAGKLTPKSSDIKLIEVDSSIIILGVTFVILVFFLGTYLGVKIKDKLYEE